MAPIAPSATIAGCCGTMPGDAAAPTTVTLELKHIEEVGFLHFRTNDLALS